MSSRWSRSIRLPCTDARGSRPGAPKTRGRFGGRSPQANGLDSAGDRGCGRGGTPSAADRLLATRLGSAGADLIGNGVFGVMVAARGEGTEPVPLDQVAGRRKLVPLEHSWIQAARRVGTCLGD